MKSINVDFGRPALHKSSEVSSSEKSSLSCVLVSRYWKERKHKERACLLFDGM